MKAAALLAVLADGRAMVVPRDDRTGEADPVALAHERCHVQRVEPDAIESQPVT